MKARKPTSVRLTAEQRQRIAQLARLRNVSRQTVIQDAIQLELFPKSKKGARA